MDLEQFVEGAEDLLEQIENVYLSYGLDLPGRRYFAAGGMGDTVHDCEQVTISFEQGYGGLPGNQAQLPSTCDEPRTGVYIVEVVRCVIVDANAAGGPNAPINNLNGTPLDKMNEIAMQQMRDAAALTEAGLKSGQTHVGGALVDVMAGSPQGGYQAMVLTVAISFKS